jgi:hypothetical protein
MKTFPISAAFREKYSFKGSLYLEKCPTCQAPPLCWCVRKNGQLSTNAHATRRGALAATPDRWNAFHRT